MGSRRCSGLRMADQSAVAEAPAPPAPVPLPTNANEQLLRIRHSTAHVMAMAVQRQRLYKDARVTIGRSRTFKAGSGHSKGIPLRIPSVPPS